VATRVGVDAEIVDPLAMLEVRNGATESIENVEDVSPVFPATSRALETME